MAHKKTAKNIKFIRFGGALLAIGLLAFGILKLSLSSNYCANSRSCIKNLTGDFDFGAKNAEFMGEKITSPAFIADAPAAAVVLGETSAQSKRIEVDLTNQMLYAYEDDKIAFSFPVSTGKWGRTPTGTFRIWVKLRYTRMSGGEGNDAYDLPNVPYVMFFYNDKVGKGQGFSLHGAYWHNNFGHTMSHGCVNISPVNAGKLYEWADPVATANTTYVSDTNPGTEVIIYGTPQD